MVFCYLNFPVTKKTMKKIVHLYQHNTVVALIVNSVAFFLYAVTIIFIVTILAVAFSG